MNFFQKQRQAAALQRERNAAAEDLEFTAPPPTQTEPGFDVEAVADLLTDRRCQVRRGPVYWAWVLSSPGFGFLLLISLMFGEPITACIGATVLLTIRLLTRQAGALQQTRAALMNAHLDNRWLGALCEALEWPDQRVRGAAALLLARLLPRLGEQDAGLLSEVQLGCLYRRLRGRAVFSDPELALAILQALPCIGSAEALPYVKRLVERPAFGLNMRRVRAGARASFSLLERRVAGEFDRQSDTDAAVTNEQEREDNALAVSGMDGVLSAEPQDEIRPAAAHVDEKLREFEEDLRRLQVPGMRVGFLIASWLVIVPYLLWCAYTQSLEGSWPGAILCAIVALLSTQLHRLTLTRQHQILARRLTRIEDVRSVGRLAEMLEWPDQAIRHGAITALTRLLRQVKASDRVLQAPRQRSNLYRMLTLANARQHADLLIAILHALEQIGDESSVPYVRNLAEAHPATTRQRRVCDAARDCMPFLETRARLNTNSQTLLRASSATTTGTEMLVRPANGVNTANEEQLLRAGAEQR